MRLIIIFNIPFHLHNSCSKPIVSTVIVWQKPDTQTENIRVFKLLFRQGVTHPLFRPSRGFDSDKERMRGRHGKGDNSLNAFKAINAGARTLTQNFTWCTWNKKSTSFGILLDETILWSTAGNKTLLQCQGRRYFVQETNWIEIKELTVVFQVKESFWVTGLFLFLQFTVFDGIYLSFMWIQMGINANSKKRIYRKF